MRPTSQLYELPALLCEIGESLPEDVARRPGPRGAFSFVEHAWHLADLDAEAFGVRVERLLREDEPFLADFDGDRAARERRYGERPLAPGLAGFRAARAANVERLAAVGVAEAMRGGTLEGFGRILLRDLPTRMLAHDRAHAAEIAALLRSVASDHPSLARLEAWAARGDGAIASPCARRAAGARLLAAVVPPGRPPIAARVRRALGSVPGADVPSVDRVAAALRMSPRTLQRRLASQGLTFQCLVEEARMAAALAFVRDGGRPLADVASLLGYSELRAFLRAFKRWTGQTPGALRRAPPLVEAGGC
jgi:AraC-like DNA-binding protein